MIICNLALLVAVNKIIESIWTEGEMVIVCLKGNQHFEVMPLFLDQTTVESFEFIDTGICLELKTPTRKIVSVEIAYDNIHEIVAYYDQYGRQETLYYSSTIKH
jgi:hypothetical protein